MREQVCKYMCPYARFQSAMFDHDTLIISYDEGRGEPRGSRPRSADKSGLGLGECVACNMCVQVCPTGIDIRHGLQYECIGCAACIDVCNGVMDTFDYPHGLIRYATQRSLAEGGTPLTLRRVLRPRVLVYGAVLLLIGGAFVTSLASRSPMRVDVVRDRGSLARLVEDGGIENVYRLQVMNATEAVQRYRVAVSGIAGATLRTRGEAVLAPAESRWVPVAVEISPQYAQALGPGVHNLVFRITREADAGASEVTVDEKSTFVVPR
jgi:cytochrome c oxidase accessory protein FixG